ncbi:MAG: hypothetical protein SGPRY_004105 [Prymnesium sp.]
MEHSALIEQAQGERSARGAELRRRVESLGEQIQALKRETQERACPQTLPRLSLPFPSLIPLHPPPLNSPLLARRPKPFPPLAPTELAPPGEADEGWLLACDASASPASVCSSLNSLLGGAQLECVRLEPPDFSSAQAFTTAVGRLLDSMRIQIPPSTFSSLHPFPAPATATHSSPSPPTSVPSCWWLQLQLALVDLCSRDISLLLRPPRWDKSALLLTARFLFAINEAFAAALEGERQGEVAVVLFGWPSDRFVAMSAAGLAWPLA